MSNKKRKFTDLIWSPDSTISTDAAIVNGSWGGTITVTSSTVTSSPSVDDTPAVQPEPFEVTPPLEDNEAQAYRRTCEAIGFKPAALVEAEILAFMAERKIKRYELEKVDAYLAKKAGSSRQWYWRPMREADADHNAKQPNARPRMNSIIGGTSGATPSRTTPYQHAIPLRVLGRVEQFIQKFGDRVKFLVSDYEVRKPDPFIAVVPTGSDDREPIVFDVWDEPDFK